MLSRLRHRTVSGRYHQDRAVHLRRTRDHVLHIVSVTRAVYVRVVTIRRLILNVRRVNRNPACLLFWRRINLVVGLRLSTKLRRQHRRDRRRQRRLAVVYVPNRANVYVWLRTLKFALGHNRSFSLSY